MIKAHCHNHFPVMRRASRVYLNDLNSGKKTVLVVFLLLCRNLLQYFIDLFWQRQDFSANTADIDTVHRGRDRFGITTRLAQCLAKQAKETVRSAYQKKKHKPALRSLNVTLYSHFVRIEKFVGSGFDWAICLTGSGAPRMIIPCKSTVHLNRLLTEGFRLAKTIRLGRDKQGRLFVDFILEKERPKKKTEGAIVGMDSNYRNGFVFSDGQVVGAFIYAVIQTFTKRQKNTYAQIKSLIGRALKQIDFSHIKTLCVEDLKRVKHNKKGTFPRVLNRRLSHWLYAYTIELLSRRCEEHGVRLEKKDPWKTSPLLPRLW